MNKEYVKLPNAWEWRKLGDVCEKITDGSHFSPKATETGYPYITVKDVNDEGKIDFKNCLFISEDDFCKLKASSCNPLKNDVLFSKDGTVGKVSIVDFAADFVVLSSLAILRPSKKLDSYYLAYAMKNPSFLKYAEDKKTGAAIKRVVLRTIKEFHIPLPPLEEQKRIVQKLDGLFAKADKAIALLDESIASASALLPSMLNEVFGELSEKWKLCKFENIAKTTSGGTPSRTNKTYWGGNIPWLKSGELNDNIVEKAEEFITDDGLKNSSAKLFPRDTLLIAMYGATAGKLGFLGFDSTTNQAICAIFNDKTKTDSKFIYYFLLKERERIVNDSFGGAQPNISQNYIRNIDIPLPPLNIQTEVVAHLDAVREKSERLSAKLRNQRAELIALKASLLERAFKGEL